MSSGPPNLGDTLTGGIQDVSALLPLIGTEQCELHTGSALEGGYLYAAATPLSIFGSLGIVKMSFSTLLCTTTWPFNGAKWLRDIGLQSTGSVSSLAGLNRERPGQVQYVAEAKFIKLLEDQHIDDPKRILELDWSGWQRRTVSAQTTGEYYVPSFFAGASLPLLVQTRFCDIGYTQSRGM
ncbi:hypothetical protein B0H13DRAFT_1613854 [Mycena leptocephala]|nr:hypothetical protein B0H13DRAFT_1613854 [Mycena leptocephala]